MVDIVEDVVQERREKEDAQKRNKLLLRLLALLCAVVLFLICAIFGLTWAVAIQMKDTYNTNNYLASSDGTVMQTAAATYSVPLYAAGVLPLDTLASIDRVTLGLSDATNDAVRANSPPPTPPTHPLTS